MRNIIFAIITSGVVVVRAWNAGSTLHLQPRTTSSSIWTTTAIARPSTCTSRKATESSSSSGGGEGLYRKFAEYGWQRLSEEKKLNLLEPINFVPSELAHQSVPARGVPDATVNIEVKALAPSDDNVESPIRLARYALLETISAAEGDSHNFNGKSGIQVLNFVIFPNETMDLPVFGADLVTLPGDKHLVAIDFQPLRVSEDGDGLLNLSKDVEAKLKTLHEKYSSVLEWGGDIPDPARRYFSQNAIWSRQSGAEGLVLVETAVLDVFKDYLEVYMDELAAAMDKHSNDALDGQMQNALVEGNSSYLAYRKANDPARPMLKSLYGEEFTERLISEVLFTDK